ncbi:MAG: hypothetical protein IT168_27070 [Bryobacterales bacterium]|nr:hypothetical protein [Bryobacterales bacterium]
MYALLAERSPQEIALAAFLIVVSVAVWVFVSVLRSSGQSQLPHPASVHKLRLWFALSLALLLAASLALTLPRMPYPAANQVPDKVIFVAAKQFAFGLSEKPVVTEQEWEAASQGPALRLPAGALIEFRISSLDVNHGFGVYSPNGRLLAQTQAMPGYVNRLRVRLNEPGRYPVLCLELCGMEHHSMRGVFDVSNP